MNREFCEREDQMSAAIRSGTVDRESALHVQHCAVCSEIVRVSKFLNDEAVLADQERTALPDPSFLWQKGRLRKIQRAVRLATRPILYMKIIACLAFACSPWLRLLLPIGREWMASWPRPFELSFFSTSKFWPSMASESAVLLATLGTLILLGLSSWYMLLQE